MTTMHSETNPWDDIDPNSGRFLLLILDAAVASDCAWPGFKAKVCFGVRDDSGEAWWEAELDRTGTGRFVDRPTTERAYDAILLMGGNEALSMVHQGCVPESPSLLQLQGDRAIMHKFLDRYLTAKNWLSIRS